MLALCATLSAACLLFTGSVAMADRDQVVRVQFLGWSATSPDVYLLRYIDEARGNRREIREVGRPVAVASITTEPSTVRRVLESAQFANWSFTVEAVEGLDAPNGWRLSGSEQGASLGLLLSNGKGVVQIGSARLKPTGTGGYAGARISQAYWSIDSQRVVVVVTHTKSGNWGLDVDEAYGFKLTAGGDSEKSEGDEKDTKDTKDTKKDE